ncbi:MULTISPECIES: CHAT domain-containing protein [unclassified Caballeronia]|uniref:CHAT domain-containing protein n=1 Tax=unclassified Caballeronia TaxID=2646786 RepID=UPI001F1F3B63|nr:MULTISPECIES: CHAT domain-containing protein [unclassified Caballeronia]MCE4545739.1 CHAT domain-containing protein [Caballeronia sp. PC1]MCE4572139.1 CHAT domain-containing protein [Caballeronia sp. CLC5]
MIAIERNASAHQETDAHAPASGAIRRTCAVFAVLIVLATLGASASDARAQPAPTHDSGCAPDAASMQLAYNDLREPGMQLAQEAPAAVPARRAQPVPPAADTAQNAPITSAARDAEARVRDAETIATLSKEGQLLLARDQVKLDGYAYCSMSVAAAERGDFRESIEAASRALVVAQRTDNANLAALSRRDLAIAYSYAGDLDDAERYAKEAIAAGAKSPDQVLAPAHKVLGDIAARRGDASAALSEYRTALETASPRYRPLVLLSLTSAQIASGDPAGARATFEQTAGVDGTLLAPLRKRIEGNLLLAENRPDAALAAFAASAGKGGSDASYDNLWAHEGMGRAYLALGNRAKAREAWLAALDDSESIRARFRSEEFKTGLFSDTQTVFEETIALVVDEGDYALAWTLSERSRSRALLDVVRNRLDKSVDATQLNGQTLSLDEVRRALAPGEAIVEYHGLADRLIAWVVRADGIQGFTLPIARRDMTLAVSDFRGAITRGRPQAIAYGAKLDALLIEPLGLRPGERLIIAPNGALHYMPFQALKNGQGFLIQRHAIALAPSASVAVQLVRREQKIASNLVAFGNPRIGPEYELPAAEAEVRAIGPLFAKSETFLQSDVTRKTFSDNAPGGRIVHVATHAQADTIDPLHSRVLLAPAAQPADGPDPMLAADIYNLRFDSVALVTLSACETALGRIARGDEIMGFTRAFFYAGASALLVSMWPVADESTELTMRTFYGALTRGEQAIDAMRDAQLAVLANSRFAHPFYWAPFDLMGNWRLSVAR